MADVLLDAVVSGSGGGDALLVSTTSNLSASVSGSGGGSANLWQITALAAAVSAASGGSASMQLVAALSGIVSGSSGGSANLAFNDRNLSSSVSGTSGGEAALSFRTPRIDFRDVINEVFMLWGIESYADANCALRKQAVNYVNASLQLIYQRGHELGAFWALKTTSPLEMTARADGVLTLNLEGSITDRVQAVKAVRVRNTVEEITEGTPSTVVVAFPAGPPSNPSLTINGVTGSISASGANSPAAAAALLAALSANSQFTSLFTATLSSPSGTSIITIATIENGPYFPDAGGIITGASDVTVQTEVEGTDDTSAIIADTSTRPRDMIQLNSHSELLNCESIYLGGRTDYFADNLPSFYFVDARLESTGQDNTGMTIMVPKMSPTDFRIEVDYFVEPIHYVWNDFIASTPLPLPHRYVESLLLPIVRFTAAQSHYFFNKEMMPLIKEQAEQARKSLGLSDPRPEPEERQKNK